METQRIEVRDSLQYSNAGFILLGAIIEKTTGQTYFDYVRDHVFHPAGMRDTDFYEIDSDTPNLATGFEELPNSKRKDNLLDIGFKGGPEGGAYSTVSDMVKFATALASGTLVSRQMLETMCTGVTEEPERQTEYGYGAQISSSNGNRVIWHGGGWKGVTDQYTVLPDLGYTVVILSNYDDDPGTIDYQIREWVTQGKPGKIIEADGHPVVTLSASCDTQVGHVGQSIAVQLDVEKPGGTAHASIVDFEVKDSSGDKVFQSFKMDQKLTSSKTKSYTFIWTPTKPGKYTIDAGIFSPRWKDKLVYTAGAIAIGVD